MGVKEANEVWEAQWSPFGAARTGGGAAKAKSPAGGKFSWQWEENGHERDKGDDSTSEEEDDEEQKEERKEHDSTVDVTQAKKKTTSFAFDHFEPAFAANAPTSSTSLAAKYAIPAISPRTLKASLTPKQRRLSASSSATSSPAIVSVPVPTVTTFSLYPASAHPGSPPPPSPVHAAQSAAAVPPTDPVSSTKAPPAMATAAAATVATTGPTPAALAAAALLKANTTHNKTIAATPEELFADLDTPAHGLSGRVRRQKAKSVCFCDEAAGGGQRVLAEVHMVPDDFTQYPIPSKKKKGKGKEKCRVM